MGKALVILTGGLASTTALFWAKNAFGEVHAITFNHGEPPANITAAKAIATKAGVKSYTVVNVPDDLLAATPPVDGVTPPAPALRNMVDLVIAANRANVLHCNAIVLPVYADDFASNDATQVFVDCMGAALNQGLYGQYHRTSLDTPLIDLHKDQILQTASEYVGCMDAVKLAFDYNAPATHLTTVAPAGKSTAVSTAPNVQNMPKGDGKPPVAASTGQVAAKT